jgi:hypothetical protein
MVPLKIVRDAGGKIETIARHYSLQRSIVLLIVAFAMVMIGVVLFTLPMPTATSFHQLKIHGLALVLAGLGIWATATAVKRIFHRQSRDVLIADKQGVRFFFYGAMGTVPWSDIRGFVRVPYARVGWGKEVLVAQLADDQKYLNKAKAAMVTNEYLPDGKFPMPFATVASARLTDLAALEEALRTMINQQRIALAQGGLSADAFREKTLASTQAATLRGHSRARWVAFTPLVIMIAVFGFAMAFRQIYGLQALRHAHTVIEIGLLAVFASFFLVRWRKRKGA